eukprot:TRINITY_DN5914_c0_g4_i1.p1 TRINITY_DN5914_c0_g4~~TRINITY_DN5914_c0_g4_i1.p1  ORF type:complete len:794 (-),score=187.87 TRINITY_DN5914_c0_g4_i1:35-2416(-)
MDEQHNNNNDNNTTMEEGIGDEQQQLQPQANAKTKPKVYALRRSKRIQTLVSNETTKKRKTSSNIIPTSSLPPPHENNNGSDHTTTSATIQIENEENNANNNTNHIQPQPPQQEQLNGDIIPSNNNNNTDISIDNSNNNNNHHPIIPQRSPTLIIKRSHTISPLSISKQLTNEDTNLISDDKENVETTPKDKGKTPRRRTSKSPKSLSDEFQSLKTSNPNISSYISHEYEDNLQNNDTNINTTIAHITPEHETQNQTVLTENFDDNSEHCIIITPQMEGVCSPSLYTDNTYISISNAPTPVIEEHNDSDEEMPIINPISLLTSENATPQDEDSSSPSSQLHRTPTLAPTSPSTTPIVRRKRRVKPEPVICSAVQVGSHTFKGTRNENQDSYCYYVDRFPYILTVCDGHGCKGREAATEAAKRIVSRIKEDTSITPLEHRTPATMAAIIQKAYENAHQLVLHDKFDYGTTVCSALINENQMISSWAGDSRVYLFTRRENVTLQNCEGEPLLTKNWGDDGTGESGVFFDQIKIPSKEFLPALTMVQLSTDHNPLRPDEKLRVESCRGRVLARKDYNLTPKKEKNPPPPKTEKPEVSKEGASASPSSSSGPGPGSSNYRVLPAAEDFNDFQIRQRALALNISRSLGHVVLKGYGVSCVPEFSVVNLVEGDIVLLCSDGLWNEIENYDLGVLIQNHFDEETHKICNIVTKEADNRSKVRKNCDNVTTIVYRHTFVNSSNSQSSSNNEHTNNNNNENDSMQSSVEQDNAPFQNSPHSLPSSSSTTPGTVFTSLTDDKK